MEHFWIGIRVWIHDNKFFYKLQLSHINAAVVWENILHGDS